jgi:benzodiazapine receptor
MRCSALVFLLLSSATAFAPVAVRQSSVSHSSSRQSQTLLPIVPHTTTTLLLASNAQESSSVEPQVDVNALVKYHGAIVIQLTIIAGLFLGLDTIVDATGIADSVPTLALVPLFWGLSLKSRTFNPLDNERPNMKAAIENGKPSKGFKDRVMPSWTPPGPVFPIMWVLIIGPLRAYSSALVWQANGHHFLDPAIMALMFHLAVGDVWNTMNNAEQRYGAAVTGVLCVTASALNAAYQYSTVDDMAGTLLGLPMIWFAVAASLVTATWQLNPSNVATGELDPLYPIVRDGKETTFAWFGGSNEAE